MKKLLSLTFLFALIFTSCSTDESSETITSETDANLMLKTKEEPKNWNPQNTANPYDQTGELYHKILEAYYANPTATTTATTISKIEELANTFTEFQTMQQTPYTSIQLANINTLLNSELNFTNCTALSTVAKNNLNSIITNLNTMSDDNASAYEINTYIINFESSIISNVAISTTDKEKILISTSIIRSNNYVHRRKKNRRWDIHYGIIAAAEGQNESYAKAVTTAAVIDVLENKE